MSSINRDYRIFPLSCDPALEETEEREIYYKYLDSAFDEPRIHNIGIAGGFGVGKSSLLRSYEKRYLRMAKLKQEINNPFKDRRKKDEPHFLYVSMGESQCNDSDNKNETERRILLQIYSRFHKKDIPSSSFEMIHESTGHLRIKTAACCLFLFLVLLLTFFTPLGKLLKATLPAASIIVHYKTEIHVALYLIVIGMAVIGGGYLIYQALTKMYVKTLALKGEKAEVAVERTDTRDYLDQYSMDLVYCLEQTVEKIGHTVVFEDMDRMKTDDVIEIFARLKEINTMVNQRLPEDKYIRFVYVVKDEVLARMEHYKFFDYVLPVLSGINRVTSEYVFRKNLKRINTFLKSESTIDELKKELDDLEKPSKEKLVSLVAPYLLDYRLQYMILNDYRFFMELNLVNKGITPGHHAAEQILALAIYKNVWPEYYDRISSGRTMLFFKEGEENQKQPELAEILRNPNYNFLRYRSLCYLGYDKSSIVFSLYHAVEDEKTVEKKIWMLDNLPNDEVTEGCLENILFVKEKKEDEDEQRKELYKEVVRISAKNHYQASLFFFLGRSLRLCLEILAELIDEGAYQYMDTLWRDGRVTDPDGTYDIFRSCRDREELVNLKDLTVDQFSILIYGLSYTEEFAGVCMEIKGADGKIIRADLGESIRQGDIIEMLD